MVVHANVAATPPDPVQLAAELKSASDELAEARTLIERLQRQRAEAEAGAQTHAAAAQKAQAYAEAAEANAEAGATAAVEQAAAVAAREAEAREAEGREEREGREAELAVARLQCEQLQGHMAHLLEETREGEALARQQAGGLAAAGIAMPPVAGVASGMGPGADVGEDWAADDLLEDTRPGEPSLKAIEAELAEIEAAQAAPIAHMHMETTSHGHGYSVDTYSCRRPAGRAPTPSTPRRRGACVSSSSWPTCRRSTRRCYWTCWQTWMRAVAAQHSCTMGQTLPTPLTPPTPRCSAWRVRRSVAACSRVASSSSAWTSCGMSSRRTQLRSCSRRSPTLEVTSTAQPPRYLAIDVSPGHRLCPVRRAHTASATFCACACVTH